MLSSSQPSPEPVVPAFPRPVRAAAPAQPVRGPIRLPLARRMTVYGVAGLTWLSGVIWLAFHAFVRAPGAFGPTSSPLEPWWLKLHGATAFAALWTFGLLWGVHTVNGWKSRRRRWSGSALFGTTVFLIGSGWLLYYAGDEDLRGLVSIAHWSVGLAAALAFLWHRAIRRRD